MSTSQTQPTDANRPSVPAPLLRAVVVCDLVDSTALLEELGDLRAAELFHQLDRRTRDLLHRHQGREIDKTDGFLLLFERPIAALAFALEYQRLLREVGAEELLPLRARVGIHVGDVVLWENPPQDVQHGAKPVEVEGMAKPVAARLMQLALPGQILLSGVAHSLAQRSREELDHGRARWRSHGRYRFKGVGEPVAVFEVGEENLAPLRRPPHSDKAHREVPWWRRPGMLAAEIALLALVVLASAYLSLRSPTAIAFGRRDWVVVGDLVNRTGENVLDGSLQAAFRIGLEQSRYINVLSDLKVRDTLTLMERDPDKTPIDRAVGCELAIRDGARALILPSVTEVGGRVRVTVEVIDPHTQATVYTEVAEGVGYGAVLPALDQVNQQLRLRLGEALASVQADSAPLPQVTTTNLDALRAYSLGLQAYAAAHVSDALELFRHAVKLDPDFALAYMGIARVYGGTSDDASTHTYIEKALALKDRLPARDQLYLDAWSAAFGPPAPMLEKWHLLGTLYPDYYAAHYNYAFWAWQLQNRAHDAIAAIQPALSEKDPLRGTAYYTLAYLQAADNQFDEAEKSFAMSASLGDEEQGLFHAAGFAAQRRFAEAMQLIDGAKPDGIPTSDIFLPQERIAVELDRGNWQRARALVAEPVAAAARLGALYGRAYRAMVLSLDDYTAPAEAQRAAVREFIAEARKRVAVRNSPNYDDEAFALLFGVYLAARAGDDALAQATLDGAAPDIRGSGYTNAEHMLTIAEAELLRRHGRGGDALARLEPSRDGTELYLNHVALADAYTAAGKYEQALAEAQWLSEHRGRAYLEINSFQILKARNVAESDLALLRMAELSHALGRDEDANHHLAAFDAVWPRAGQPEFAATRARKLSGELHLASSEKTF